MITSYRIYRNMTPPTKTDAPICIELVKYPSFWVWLVAELEQGVSECCTMLHDVPLPKWLLNWERAWGCDCTPAPDEYGNVWNVHGGETTDVNGVVWKDMGCACWSKFSDYYGDDIGSLWHLFVEVPLSEYVFQRTRDTRYDVNVPLDTLKGDSEIGWIEKQIEVEAKGENNDTPCAYCGHAKLNHGSEGICYAMEGFARCKCGKYEPNFHTYDWRDDKGTSLLFRFMEFVTRPLRKKPNGSGPQN